MSRYAERAAAPPAKTGPVRQQPRSAPLPRPSLPHVLQLRAAQSARAEAAAGAQSRGGLPVDLKAGIEQLSGVAMDDVRIHRNSPEPARLGALAYARGSDIHLGPGQDRHLPHEAWHVVQQKQGRVKPTMQMKGSIPVNDDAGLEREADRMGARAASGVAQPDSQTGAVSAASHGSGQGAVQMIGWHDQAHGDAFVQNVVHVPTINGVTDDNKTTTINVAGRNFVGPLYSLPQVKGKTKVSVVIKIAEALGAVTHPKSNKFLSRAQLQAIGLNQRVPGNNLVAGIPNGGYRATYMSRVDPYMIRIPGLIDEQEKIAINYQFGVDSYGYIVRIEQEGKSYDMDAARGQAGLLEAQRKKLKKGETDDPLFEKFSAAHDTENPSELISEVASKSTAGLVLYGKAKHASKDSDLEKLKEKSNRLDAMARIGGEGSRWVCVRELAKKGKLTNGSIFYTDSPDDAKAYIGMTFQNLWLCWAELFNMDYNIPDTAVRAILLTRHAADDNRIVTFKKPKETDYDLG
jgi:hypothetical protein